MKKEQDTKCVNWFMHKKGKHWVYGCSILVCSAVTLGVSTTQIKADKVDNVSSSTTLISKTNESITTSNTGEELKDSNTENNINTSKEENAKAPKETEVATDTTSAVTQTTNEANNVSDIEEDTQKDDSTAPAETATVAAQENNAVVTGSNTEKTNVESQNNQASPENYKTNLEGVKHDDSWKYTEDGLYSNAVGKGDNFYFSESTGKDFVFQTDVTFLQNTGAASLVFRANNDTNNLRGYVVNLDGNSHKVKLWRWAEANLIDEKEIAATQDNKYSLKVVAIGGWISYYVNNVLVANLSDYTLQRNDLGQTTYIPEGHFGLLNWNGEMVFQNTFYKELTDKMIPTIDDVTVSSKKGSVESKGQFFSKGATYIQYVSNAADTVDLSFVKHNQDAKIIVTDSNGKTYTDYQNIPLSVGANYLTVTSSYVTTDGYTATVTYRINIHRRQSDKIYYNEAFRDQYHYSVKDGWANDPNGLVYYHGKYHMFYQFYDDTQWGPMHWAHATSTDLLHWKEEPIAFYPDYNGTMFSGCIVADENNTSGLFEGNQGGLVALITNNGEGQRIKVAYSADEGKTWTKVDKIVADWTTDPLQVRDFRDPKVFRWNGKWFMVLAGGPLRIYSSSNLLDWNVESTYPDLHTECPDLYPIQTKDGVVKWVLSRGGRYYKIGDFKEINGKWQFVADKDYQETDGVMNFGKDSYAAMTYYVQDFGTSEKPTLPEIIELNWMNTWDDYCNLVANRLDQKFNGTFNLNLSVGLVKEGDKYVLTQTPVKAYENLRDLGSTIYYHDVSVASDNTLFKDFKGDTYEIVAHFKPSQGTTKVGFNLRVGNGEVTKVVYDLQSEKLYIDRSNSGITLTNKFKEIDSQNVTRNADGSLDLHLFVDRASVEVFARNNTVAGANQIFADPQSLGLGVLVEGDATQADIALYPLKSIWTDKKLVTEPLEMVAASEQTVRMNVGDNEIVKVYLAPVSDATKEIAWEVNDASIIATEINDNQVIVKALKKGTVTLRASLKENPAMYKEFTINVLENNFKTNLNNTVSLSGDWYIDGESLLVANNGSNDIYMSTDKVAQPNYQLDFDLQYEKGLVNIFFASEKIDPANAYTIQLGNDNTVRLFRFYGDTIFESKLPKLINDNQLHHVKVVKDGKSVRVLVDDVEVLAYTFESVDDYFDAPYIGLGLWDGKLAIQNLFVNGLASEPIEVQPVPEKQPDNETTDGGTGEIKPEDGTDKETISKDGDTSVNVASLPENKMVINEVGKVVNSDINVEKLNISLGERKAPYTNKQTAQTLPKTGEGDQHLSAWGILTILSAIGLFFAKYFRRRSN